MTNGYQNSNQSPLPAVALAAAIMAILLSGFSFIILDDLTQKARVEAANNNRALCSLRADVAERLRNSKEFLRKNPKGIPGIPVSVLKQGQVGQRATIKALRDLRC